MIVEEGNVRCDACSVAIFEEEGTRSMEAKPDYIQAWEAGRITDQEALSLLAQDITGLLAEEQPVIDRYKAYEEMFETLRSYGEPIARNLLQRQATVQLNGIKYTVTNPAPKWKWDERLLDELLNEIELGGERLVPASYIAQELRACRQLKTAKSVYRLEITNKGG